MFQGKGRKARPDPTKGDIAKSVKANQEAAQMAAFSIQRMLQGIDNDLQKMAQRLAVLESKYNNVTYYTLAIGNVLSKEEDLKTAIKEEIRRLKDIDFRAASDADDKNRKLVNTVADYQISKSDVVTLGITASDVATDTVIEDLSLFRSKLDIGKGEIKIIEDQLIGLKKGESREWTSTLGAEFGQYNGKVVKFKAEIFDIKTLPVEVKEPVVAPVEKPVEVAPAVEEPVVKLVEPEITKE